MKIVRKIVKIKRKKKLLRNENRQIIIIRYPIEEK